MSLIKGYLSSSDLAVGVHHTNKLVWISLSVSVLSVVQVLTRGGTVPLTLPSMSLTWLWFASWWRTMTTPQAMTSLDNTPCLLPVSVQVCVGTVEFGWNGGCPKFCSADLLSFTSPGYRHVRLLKLDGSNLSPSSLFIHVKVTPCQSSPSKSSAKSPAKSSAKKP